MCSIPTKVNVSHTSSWQHGRWWLCWVSKPIMTQHCNSAWSHIVFPFNSGGVHLATWSLKAVMYGNEEFKGNACRSDWSDIVQLNVTWLQRRTPLPLSASVSTQCRTWRDFLWCKAIWKTMNIRHAWSWFFQNTPLNHRKPIQKLCQCCLQQVLTASCW